MPKTADEGALADFCIASVQGAMLMGKIERSSRPVETTVSETLGHLRRYIQSANPKGR
jgi:hypothetical protein